MDEVGFGGPSRAPVTVASTILLIAPEAGDRSRLAAMLEPRGHVVIQAESGTQARGVMPPVGSDLVVILDLAGGPEAIRYLRGPAATRANAPVVCLADRRVPGASSEALRLGVADLVGRPVRESDLLAAVANARELTRATWPAPELAPDETSPNGVFGASPAMREVLSLMRRVASSRCAVLLTGERGTGREMVARGIHAEGPHRAAPFVKIACAEASLHALDGLCAAAPPAGATVFFDNLQDLSLDQQRRLLAHLHGFDDARRRGDDAPVDIRFIAGVLPHFVDLAPRSPVQRALLDALGVVRIDVPPLRQRAEDVPLVATHFLKEACRRQEMPLKTFSRSAVLLLAALPWPGNAEELRALTERLTVLIPRGTVLLEDVLTHVRFDGAEALGRTRGTLRDAREGFERDYIVSVLQHHHGRMGAAALELGIERTNLYRKIKQLNISWSAGPE